MATNNAFAAFVQGRQAGQQARAFEQEHQDRNALRTLAPQILAGDPSAFDQAAAINPQAAVAYQGAGDTQLRRLKGALDYFDQGLKSGDDRLIQARFKEISPFLSRVTGNEAPPAWTAEMAPAFEQAKTRVAMLADPAAGSGVQSTYVDDQGNRVAIMRDGSTQVLGRNNASIRVLEPEGAVPYGVVTSGGRAGQMVGIGGGMPAEAPAPPAASASPAQGDDTAQRAQTYYQQMRSAGLSDEQAMVATEAMLSNMGYQQAPSAQAQAAAPAGAGMQQPPRTPTSAERAGASERARLQAQLDYAPQVAESEAEAAGMRESAVQDARTSAEKQAGRGKARLSLEQATSRLNRVDTLVESIMPRIGALTAGWAGNALSNVPGTAASDLRKDIGTLQAIAGFDELNAMRASSPTGGALGNVTERELAFLQSVVRNIESSQSPDQLRRNLQEFQREVRQSWQRVRDAYNQDYGSETSAARRARNPQTGEMLILRNGQWVPEDGR